LRQKSYQQSIIAVMSIAFLAGCMIFWVAWIASNGDLSPNLPRALSMLEEEDSSFGWRVQQWGDYGEVYNHEPILDEIIGQPLGILRLVADENSVLFVTAHNGYVQLLLSVGALGVSLFVLVLMWAIIRGFALLVTVNSTLLSSNLRWALALVISDIVYSIGYVLPNEQGLLLALALQIVAGPFTSPPTVLNIWAKRSGRINKRLAPEFGDRSWSG
jgi:O-antigen ligase